MVFVFLEDLQDCRRIFHIFENVWNLQFCKVWNLDLQRKLNMGMPCWNDYLCCFPRQWKLTPQLRKTICSHGETIQVVFGYSIQVSMVPGFMVLFIWHCGKCLLSACFFPTNFYDDSLCRAKKAQLWLLPKLQNRKRMTLTICDSIITLACLISLDWLLVRTAAEPCAQYTLHTDQPTKTQSNCECDGNVLVSCAVIPYFNEYKDQVSLNFDSFECLAPNLKKKPVTNLSKKRCSQLGCVSTNAIDARPISKFEKEDGQGHKQKSKGIVRKSLFIVLLVENLIFSNLCHVFTKKCFLKRKLFKTRQRWVRFNFNE